MKTNFFLLCLGLLVSCEITDIDYDTYTIKNNTDKTVTILAYDRYYHTNDQLHEFDVPFLTDSIVILPMGQYFIKKRTGEDDQPRGYFKNGVEDSVVFIFDYKKRLTFVCTNIDPSFCSDFKNPMNYNKFSEKKYVKKRGYDYTYSVTQEDYENAQPY